MADNIEARFAAETELLGLKLLPGQGSTLLAAYAALREMVALVGRRLPDGSRAGPRFHAHPAAERGS